MAETTVLRSSAINRTPNAGAKPQAQLSGAIPVVHVNMNSGGPQIQGGQGTARQGVTLLPPKGGTQRFTTGGLPNQPAKQGVVILPRGAAVAATAVAPLTADQLLLCRHLADKYIGELRGTSTEAPLDPTAADNVKLAEAAIIAIDGTMAAMTAAAAVAVTAPPQRVVSGGGGRQAATATPRRVARPAPPPVAVKMEAGQPVLIQADPPTEVPSQVPSQGSGQGPIANNAQG